MSFVNLGYEIDKVVSVSSSPGHYSFKNQGRWNWSDCVYFKLESNSSESIIDSIILEYNELGNPVIIVNMLVSNVCDISHADSNVNSRIHAAFCEESWCCDLKGMLIYARVFDSPC